MSNPGAPAVAIRGVSKSFAGQLTLRSISLEVAPSEIFCILGPSGCGKTTLLNLVAGLLTPDAGEIVRPARLGYVFQEPRLLPWRTVQENVAFGLKALGMPADQRAAVAAAYLERLGLAGVAGDYPHQLSGGMRQRVALGRALAIDPDLLLLDEPFKSLDVLLRVDLLKLLLEEWRLKPRTVLFVTHEVQEAALVAHRAAVFSRRPAEVCAIVAGERPPHERRPGDPDVQRMEARLYRLLTSGECPTTAA
jgi:NitT/TauT family transport system ATP-binding protein